MPNTIGHNLDEAQKIFIRKKVQQLGSINSAQRLYRGNCLVDEYARQVAYEIYPDQNQAHISYRTPIIPSNTRTNNKNRSYRKQNKETKTGSTNKGYSEQSEKRSDLPEDKSSRQKTSYQMPAETKNTLDREAYLAALERKKERDKQTGGIPEHEEGTLRTEWGTREDHKKMRARDWGDMQKRRKE